LTEQGGDQSDKGTKKTKKGTDSFFDGRKFVPVFLDLLIPLIRNLLVEISRDFLFFIRREQWRWGQKKIPISLVSHINVAVRPQEHVQPRYKTATRINQDDAV
jgi:hypothetical protein